MMSRGHWWRLGVDAGVGFGWVKVKIRIRVSIRGRGRVGEGLIRSMSHSIDVSQQTGPHLIRHKA